MAITGTLNADFSNFETAVKRAEVSLRGMEGGAVKVEAAVSQIATNTAPPMNTLRESFGQVDQTLSAAGVNVGKYAKGLFEIGEMSGKTVSQLGALATGASIFSAAMAGWQFGTWIAGITGLDKAVQKYADSLAGLPTEVAAAKQDVINRAIANGAHELITYNEAIKFNIQFVKDQSDKYATSSERLAAAQKEVRGLSEATIAAIEIAKRNGATTEQITNTFKISADGLRALAERQKLAGQAAEAHTKELEKQQAIVRKLDADYDKLMSDVSNANQLAIMEADATRMAAEALKKKNDAAAGWIANQVKITAGVHAEAAATAAYLKEQDALTAATDALSQTHTEVGAAASAATTVAVQGWQGVAQAVELSGDAIREWLRLMQYTAEANAILNTNSLFTTSSQLTQIANIGGGPFGNAGRSGGASVVNHFNIVDTESNLAHRLSARVTDSIKRLGPV